MKKILLLSLITLLPITSFSALAADNTSNTVASVNGTSISNEAFDIYSQMRSGHQASQDLSEKQKQEILDELINRELIYQDAVNKGMNKDPEVQTQIEDQTRNIITTHRLRKLLEEQPPTQAQLQKAYQTQIVEPASIEYKASHILLENEADAKAITDSLKSGANFAELAKEKSTGPSGNDGGSLGWFSPNQMVKPFADTVAKLNKGDVSPSPVQTQFGWHVILLEDVRKIDPPPFDKVEKQLLKVVQNQIIGDHISGLKAKANIDIKPF